MQKHISSFIFLLLLFANSALYANNKELLKGAFLGTITSTSNVPIAGASVYIVDIKIGGTTDANGHFSIQNIPEGKHLVEISHIGYNSIAVQIEIIGHVKKDFQLTETVVENNAVIVTGVSNATLLKKIPFSVTSIKKDDIFNSSATNIIDAVSKVGGISTLSTGPAIAKPIIRGLGYNRVLTINDGVRQEGQQWGDEHGIEIDEASVSKIEILKGPASLIYGSDAMAGVLNITTNVPVAVNILKGSISSNYQTNNRLRSINATIAGNENGFNWSVYSSNRAAADYKNKYDGYVYNSKFKENNVGGYVGYNGKWGYSHVVVSNFNLKTGLIEGERDDEGFFIKPLPGGGEARATNADFKSVSAQIPFQQINHFKIASDNSFKINTKRLSLNIGYQQNKREEFGNIDDLNEQELFFDLKTLTYNTQLHFEEKKGYKTSVGINGMQQNNTNKGVEQLIPNYNLFDVGGFVYTQKSYKKVTISGGVRYDTRNINTKDLMDGGSVKEVGLKKSFANFSASAGVAVQSSDKLNIKFNIARAYRAPSIPELMSNGAHEGTTRYEYGNRNLKNETSLQLDGGLSFTTEHISLGVNVFYNSFSNFIFYQKLQNSLGGDSIVNVNGDDLTAFTFNQRKANLYGAEINVDIHPHPLDWLHIQNTFSIVRGQFANAIEGSNNLPFMPAPKLITEFRGDFARVAKQIKNVHVTFEIDNTFAQSHIFDTYNTETKTKGYTLLNAGIGGNICNKKEMPVLNFSFNALNIADVGFQNHLNRLKYAATNLATGRNGVFNMGRNFSFKINIPFISNLK
ncbi:MAG: TonB-dependent receptor [Ferruginibacter sp.]|nr:TonB-dependent receptor [Ferruginibacter sp.]